MRPFRVGLCTYGNRRARQPLNSVLLTHSGIARGFREDPRFELRDYSPPLRDDREVDFEAASRVHLAIEADLDAVVVQASSPGLECLTAARDRCPSAIRVLHRDSSHAVAHRDILRAQQARHSAPYELHYDGPLLDREVAEYDAADFVTVPSRWALSTFASQGYRRAVHVGPQCIELRRWQAPPRRFRRGEQVYLFAGQLGLRKGVLDALEAWRLAGAPGKLLVAGLPDSAATAPMIQEAVARTPRCTAVGHVPFHQLADLYRSASALLMPSHEEGAAMVCYEAMAAGLPLVATPSAGCDILEDGVTGREVPAGRPDLLAAAIQEYAGDDGRRYEHGARAAAAAAKCDVAAYAARYASAVAAMLG